MRRTPPSPGSSCKSWTGQKVGAPGPLPQRTRRCALSGHSAAVTSSAQRQPRSFRAHAGAPLPAPPGASTSPEPSEPHGSKVPVPWSRATVQALERGRGRALPAWRSLAQSQGCPKGPPWERGSSRTAKTPPGTRDVPRVWGSMPGTRDKRTVLLPWGGWVLSSPWTLTSTQVQAPPLNPGCLRVPCLGPPSRAPPVTSGPKAT